ncbi:MAG: hypothetical protein ACE5NA_00070 [Nitrospiraceae bacterium]
MIELRAPDAETAIAAIRKGWMHDDERNWRWGFGRGEPGRVKAVAALVDILTPDQNRLVREVQIDGERIGLLVGQHRGVETRSVIVQPYLLSPCEEALEEFCAMLFSAGKGRVFRITAELLTPAREEKAMFRSLGFREEGCLRKAHWNGINAIDRVILAMLLPAWSRRGLRNVA